MKFLRLLLNPLKPSFPIIGDTDRRWISIFFYINQVLDLIPSRTIYDHFY